MTLVQVCVGIEVLFQGRRSYVHWGYTSKLFFFLQEKENTSGATSELLYPSAQASKVFPVKDR